MNVIDSPVDALVFDYVRIGLVTVVNNLWAWVAVITAAVSFWRIRAVAGAEATSSVTVGSSCAVKPEPKATSARADQSLPPPPSTSTSPSSSPVAAMSSCFYDDGGLSVTRGKFVVYYEEDRAGDGEGDGEDDGEGDLTERGDDDGCKEWWDNWEKVLKMRRGEMGWYRYQDLTALHGNVVRLWDGVRRDSLVW